MRTARHDRGRERSGQLRIIGGEWRGRRLRIPPGTDVRPTPDRVRETVFNWLRDHIEGARVLDLFAGSGALGFESLSRGAAEAWLVERDAALADALLEHAESLKAGSAVHVVRDDARRFLERSRDGAVRWNVAFVDPPYREPVEPLLAALWPSLARGALVYVERPAEEGLPDVPGAAWVKTSRAASVAFGLLAPARGDAAA